MAAAATACETETAGSPTPKFWRSSSESQPLPKYRHLHKLEKKQSSGDLQSRLKTRKLLGVGETDDGDVHRSKLSQILGHSEQLYTRLPKGLRVWQLLLAVMFTVVGLMSIVRPNMLFDFAFDSSLSASQYLPMRLYGASLIGMSIIYWAAMKSMDRDMIMWSMVASAAYFLVQLIAAIFHVSFLWRTVPTLSAFVASTYFACTMENGQLRAVLKGLQLQQ